MTHGPVEIAFFAFSDFMDYKSGAPPPPRAAPPQAGRGSPQRCSP
jgi:hypothetical protein